MPKDPETKAEWQEAVDAAEFYLVMESVRMYGLLQGGPGVTRRRCEEILERGAKEGFKPRPVQELTLEFLK